MSVFLLFKSKKVYFATGGKMYYLTVENSFDSAHFYTAMKENVQIYMVIVGE